MTFCKKRKISNLPELIELINSEEFDKTNSQYLRSDFPEKCFDGPCLLGVDEAGRGPVLGPMVYAVCYCPLKNVEIIKNIGCTDSKTLTQKKREEIFELINSSEHIGWAADIISPNFISNKMLKRVKYSLNEVAQNSTIKLIESVLERNINISEIYVDTVGPPEKYQAFLSKIFSNCKVIVEKKADLSYPVVGAASICAKVIRDSVIENWKFPEIVNLSEKNFGTGYPGDPKSKQFLSDVKDEIFGFPNFVRFSWSTAEKLMEEIVHVEWENGNETESGSKNTPKLFNYFGQSSETKHKSKSRFFKERSLSSAESF